MLPEIGFAIYIAVFFITFFFTKAYGIRTFSSLVFTLLVSLVVYLCISPEDKIYGLTSGDIESIVFSIIYLVTVFMVIFHSIICIFKDH